VGTLQMLQRGARNRLFEGECPLSAIKDRVGLTMFLWIIYVHTVRLYGYAYIWSETIVWIELSLQADRRIVYGGCCFLSK
jgi:hypothetical protein